MRGRVFFFKYSISVSILYISYRQKQKFFGILYNLSVYRIPETRNLRTAALYYVCACSVVQWCPTLGDPLSCSPPGSSVHGIFQTRILEWAAFPPSGDCPNPGIKPQSPALQADSLLLSHQGSPTCNIWSSIMNFHYQVIHSGSH